MEHVSYNNHFKGKLNVKHEFGSQCPSSDRSDLLYLCSQQIFTKYGTVIHKRLTQHQSFQVSNGQEQGCV
jgi:hypothetical protein